MEEDNNLKNVLDKIQDSIRNIDNKAASILTAIGIVFGLSTSLIEPMFRKTTMAITQTMSYITGGLYLASSSLCILFLVLTIYPRHKSKKFDRKTFYSEYYIDAHKYSDDYSFLSAPPTTEQMHDQIKTCSEIAYKKNCYIKIAITLTSISIFFLTTTILLVSFTIANPIQSVS